jgi:Flp pilus assembly protein TadD/4-amino-4-deoxy-L-arabinose transferase-like glycosyltransferase
VIDEEAYDRQAMALVESGDWLGDRVFYQDPFYPYFLAVVYKIFGHHLMVVRVIQALLGALHCLVIYRLGAVLFDRKVGIVAGLGAAVYKPFLFQETLILKSSLVLLFLGLALLLLLGAQRSSRKSRWMAAGLCLGLGILVRGNYLLFAPVAALWGLCVLWKATPSRAIGSVACFAAGVAVVILPVTIRNYVVAKDFVLTTSQGGTNFYAAHHPDNRTGTLKPPPFVHTTPAFEDRDYKREAERRTGREGMKPSEVSRYWFRAGLDAIAEDPGLLAYRTWKKLRYATTDFEPPDNQSLYFVQRYFSSSLRFNPFTFGVIFPLGLVGLMLSMGRGRPLGLLYLFLATYLASLLVFYVFARSRLPLVPPLLIFAAFGAVTVLRECRMWKKGRWAACALIFVLAALWAWWPVAPVSFSIPWNNLGTMHVLNGDIEKAEAAFRNILELDPDEPMGHRGLGLVARTQGDLPNAKRHYERAVELDPENWQARGELAVILIALRDVDGAEEQLKAALQSYPNAAPLHAGLGRVHLIRKRYESAIESYGRALDLDGESAEAHLGLGLVYRSRGRGRTAVEHFKEALRLEPDAPYAEEVRRYIQALKE